MKQWFAGKWFATKWFASGLWAGLGAAPTHDAALQRKFLQTITVIDGLVQGFNEGDFDRLADTDLPDLSDVAVTSINGSTGAVTIAALTPTAVTPGSYTLTNITVDAYGRITAAASGTAPVLSWNGSTGAVVVDGDALAAIFDAEVASTATYTNATVTVDQFGRVVSASSGATPSAVVSPSAMTADVNALNVSLATITVIRMTTNGAGPYGIHSLLNGVDGKVAIFVNIHATDTINLMDNSGSGTAGSRFNMGPPNVDFSILPGKNIAVFYDGTTSRWRRLFTV